MSREAPPVPEEVTPAPEQAAPEISPEISREPSRSIPELSRVAPETPETPDGISDEIRRRVFSEASDDDLKNHPALRDRYNKLVSTTQKKLEEQSKQRELETQRWVAMEREVDYLEKEAAEGRPQALLQQLASPQAAANIARVKEWKQTRQANTNDLMAQAANSMVDGLAASLKEEPDWADLTAGEWSDIFGERDVKTVLARLVVAGTAKERKSLQAKARAEIEAGINDALTKRGLAVPAPESPHGAVVGDGAGGLTLEQYGAMSPSERRALRRDNPQAVDAMTSGLLESHLAGPPAS
jgi:hypothetical protein